MTFHGGYLKLPLQIKGGEFRETFELSDVNFELSDVNASRKIDSEIGPVLFDGGIFHCPVTIRSGIFQKVAFRKGEFGDIYVNDGSFSNNSSFAPLKWCKLC